MTKKMRWALAGALSVTLLAAPSVTLAAEGVAAGGGAGCKANGQAVATAAQSLRPFGQVVKANAPIADNVAAFKAAVCTAPAL